MSDIRQVHARFPGGPMGNSGVDRFARERLEDLVVVADVTLADPRGGGDVHHRTRVTAAELSAIRHRVGDWAARTGLDEDDQSALVLATYEALTNAVDHAYRDSPDGEVELCARTGRHGQVIVTVTDHGRWRTPPLFAGSRGHGLRLIQALADTEIDRGRHGTRVTMSWPHDPDR